MIREGIAHRGTTFRDYVDGEGRQGGFQALLRVYGREGQPCAACGGPIVRIKLAGRSSFFVPAVKESKFHLQQRHRPPVFP
ncbi:MAG: zinc finger domain-containing protein [Limnochordia bacterium]